MARSLYRKGRASHSDELRDARKVLFYAQAEVERLEKLQPKPIKRELYDDTEKRMDVVGQNGSDGLAYENEWIPTGGKKPDLPDGTLVDVKFAAGGVTTGSSPDSLAWAQDGTSYSITHYRIHKP